MVVLVSDMNGHVGSSNVGYVGTHGGFGYGARNADGSRIFEFIHVLNQVTRNTMFMESNLVTYAAGSFKSMVDYIIVWQDDKAKVHNIKVNPNEEYVPKHKLLNCCGLIQQKDSERSSSQDNMYSSLRRKRRRHVGNT